MAKGCYELQLIFYYCIIIFYYFLPLEIMCKSQLLFINLLRSTTTFKKPTYSTIELKGILYQVDWAL